MPRFDPNGKKNAKKDGGDEKRNLPARQGPGKIIEPRCHVCNSPHRDVIDRMLILGTSYSEISRLYNNEIDRRSISNHDKEHLSLEDAAIRRMIEEEAKRAEANIEEGVQGAMSRRVYLQTALRKAQTALLSDEITVEPKDAIAIIQLLDKLDGQTEGAAIDEIRLQFSAFLQAVQEIVDANTQTRILDRTKQLLGVDPAGEIEPIP